MRTWPRAPSWRARLWLPAVELAHAGHARQRTGRAHQRPRAAGLPEAMHGPVGHHVSRRDAVMGGTLVFAQGAVGTMQGLQEAVRQELRSLLGPTTTTFSSGVSTTAAVSAASATAPACAATANAAANAATSDTCVAGFVTIRSSTCSTIFNANASTADAYSNPDDSGRAGRRRCNAREHTRFLPSGYRLCHLEHRRRWHTLPRHRDGEARNVGRGACGAPVVCLAAGRRRGLGPRRGRQEARWRRRARVHAARAGASLVGLLVLGRGTSGIAVCHDVRMGHAARCRGTEQRSSTR